MNRSIRITLAKYLTFDVFSQVDVTDISYFKSTVKIVLRMGNSYLVIRFMKI